MRLLSFESSCDETSCALVEVLDGEVVRPLAQVVSSQIEVHNAYGGVVPEVASRQHIKRVVPLIKQVFHEAGCAWNDVHAVAVTQGPGLVGALLVAVQLGKAIAFARQVPLIGVNHLEGHLRAVYVHTGAADFTTPGYPHLALLVSGGHTLLVGVSAPGRYEVLGSTRDDAAGEAFDKVGKLLGLGYPAGPVIDRLAAQGDPTALRLPQAMQGARRGLDFSYSGLKTWMSAYVQQHGVPQEPSRLADVCASFQAAVVEQLVRKTRLALESHPATALIVTGGVACNRALRAALQALCATQGVALFVPPPLFCTDNAAMIGAAGALRLQQGKVADWGLNARAHYPLEALRDERT